MVGDKASFVAGDCGLGPRGLSATRTEDFRHVDATPLPRCEWSIPQRQDYAQARSGRLIHRQHRHRFGLSSLGL